MNGGERPAAVELPDGAEVVRTTKRFEARTVPHGLLRAHALDREVWARIVVEAGTVEFVFEDLPTERRSLAVGDHQIVPPVRLHHITPDDDARFFIEFLRLPGA